MTWKPLVNHSVCYRRVLKLKGFYSFLFQVFFPPIFQIFSFSDHFIVEISIHVHMKIWSFKVHLQRPDQLWIWLISHINSHQLPILFKKKKTEVTHLESLLILKHFPRHSISPISLNHHNDLEVNGIISIFQGNKTMIKKNCPKSKIVSNGAKIQIQSLSNSRVPIFCFISNSH